jgi:hypothetical protein
MLPHSDLRMSVSSVVLLRYWLLAIVMLACLGSVHAGVGWSSQRSDRAEALIEAAENGDLAVVNRMLQNPRVDPTAADNYAIRLAARNGHLAVVNRHLEVGADPTAFQNLAIIDADNGHFAVFERLLLDPRVDLEWALGYIGAYRKAEWKRPILFAMGNRFCRTKVNSESVETICPPFGRFISHEKWVNLAYDRGDLVQTQAVIKGIWERMNFGVLPLQARFLYHPEGPRMRDEYGKIKDGSEWLVGNAGV